MEVASPGVESEKQLPVYTTNGGTLHPRLICNLHHSSEKCRVLNPLSQANDGTHLLMAPVSGSYPPEPAQELCCPGILCVFGLPSSMDRECKSRDQRRSWWTYRVGADSGGVSHAGKRVVGFVAVPLACRSCILSQQVQKKPLTKSNTSF